MNGAILTASAKSDLAVALAADSNIDELGDSDDRHSGIEDDARICNLILSHFESEENNSRYLLGGHVDLGGFEADFF